MIYISLQENYYDCGFACIKMMLANSYKNHDYLMIKKTKLEGAYSLLELKEIAKVYELELEGYEFDEKELIFDHPNAIVQIQDDKRNHFVYLHSVTKKKVIILDPAIGKIELQKEEFLVFFTGKALVNENKKVHKKFKIENKVSLVPPTYCFLYILSLFLDFVLVYLMGYISFNNAFFNSLLVVVGIIASYGMKIATIIMSKKKVNLKVSELIENSKEKKINRQQLEILLSLPKTIVNYLFSNLNYIFIGLGVFILLIVKSKYHIFFLVFIIIAFLCKVSIREGKNNYKSLKISILEKKVLYDNKNLVENYNSLNKEADDFIKIESFLQGFIYFLVGISVILSNNMSSSSRSFENVVVYLAYYLIFSDQVNKLVTSFNKSQLLYEQGINTYSNLLD